MGIPVVGKNYFPSNIQGLPTWYEIRVTKDGYQCRSNRVDVMIAMNAQTYAMDMSNVSSGGWLVYDSTWPRSKLLDREDITVIGIPLSRMCNEHFDGVRTRILMKNIAYVGAVAALMDIDLEVIKGLLEETFATKEHLIASNMEAIHLGYDYAIENFSCPLPPKIEKMDATNKHVVIDGNTASALGCVYAGATVGHPGGRRTRGNRHGAGCKLDGRTLVHADQRSGNFSYERIHRLRLLCRDSGGDIQCTTHGPVDRHADADATVGHYILRLRVTW
jgi:2-oxoglutarate ferredoxin oxidoreductase subunit alpha